MRLERPHKVATIGDTACHHANLSGEWEQFPEIRDRR